MEFLDKGGVATRDRVDRGVRDWNVTLRAGRCLLMFTDGVVEAFNAEGRRVRKRALAERDSKSADRHGEPILRYLMRQVDEFVGATRQSDDITCLVFQCK